MPKRLVKSFTHAQRGIKHTLTTQRNIWIHFSAGVAVLLLAAYLRINLEKFMILVLTVCLVVVAEVINTSIETVLDFVSPSKHEKVALAKDVAAGAVLFASFGAVIIGILIFGPIIWGAMGWR